jgi:hypothetical protein
MFPLTGQHVSIDLANSLFVYAGRRIDALSGADQVREWVAAVADLKLADGGTLTEAGAGALTVDETFRQSLVDLRGEVRDLFIAYAHAHAPSATTVERLNRFTAAAPRRLHALPTDGALTVHRERIGSPEAGFLAALAEDALALTADPELTTRLFQCQGHGCIGVLLRDDPRRAYCSDRCATRARVARHAARNKSG